MTVKCNHCGGNHLANHKSQACHDHYKSLAELLKKQHNIIINILTDSQLDTRVNCGKTIREYLQEYDRKTNPN